MRAQQQIDLEFFFAADQKSHLVVGHDRHRNIGDGHPPDFDRVENSEVHADGLTE